MPPFYFRRRWTRWRPRYRRQFFRRRLRKAIRPRFRRRRWVRRRFYKRRFKRKLRKIKLTQWQPNTIRKCTIKGHLCLLACGRGRINHNYILTCESIVPTKEPGGGAWSILQFSLRVLWDEYTHYRNWWTTSNQGLPLCRYNGCKFKFYRAKDTDYIVTPQITGPFEVTRDIYLNTQPYRHLMNKKSFIVRRQKQNSTSKPYIKKRFHPPALLQNKWYFQQDLLNTPLIMFTISACDFDQFYCPSDQISTNITLITLNTDVFRNQEWDTVGNQPYKTNYIGTQETYLYSTGNGITSNVKYTNVFPVVQTEIYTPKNNILPKTFMTNYDDFNTKTNWTNPFSYAQGQKDVHIFYGPKPTTSNFTATTLTTITSLFDTCRYNPFKDKGTGNIVYIKPTNTIGKLADEPTDENLKIKDFPLWLVTWAWQDWILKSKPAYHLMQEWQLIIKSPYIEPKKPCYLFLDAYFYNPPEHIEDILTETDKAKWHPKLDYQQEALEAIAKSGPLTPKVNIVKQIQTQCLYEFFFKWGGCPAPMETITNPADQERYPNPNNLIQGLEIQSPETDKQYFIYQFDERDTMLTKTAAKRLKQNIKTAQLLTDFGPKNVPEQAQEKISQEETPSTKEETQTEKLQQLINNLQQQRRDLRHRIDRLLKTPKYYPTM